MNTHYENDSTGHCSFNIAWNGRLNTSSSSSRQAGPDDTLICLTSTVQSPPMKFHVFQQRRYVNQDCSVRLTEYVITPQPMMGFCRDMVQTDPLSSRQMVDE
jgi:hypothetical protein